MEVVGRKMNGAAIGEIPAPITSFPQHIMSFPQHIMSFPQHITSFPQHIMSFPQHIMSFPRRRESPVLRSTTYPWEHPSPRKVTGRIRRMVRGWRIQNPAFAGMMWVFGNVLAAMAAFVQFARSGFLLYALARVMQGSPSGGKRRERLRAR